MFGSKLYVMTVFVKAASVKQIRYDSMENRFFVILIETYTVTASNT